MFEKYECKYMINSINIHLSKIRGVAVISVINNKVEVASKAGHS